MYCTNCGHKNDENANFCQQCGAPLRKTENVEVKRDINRPKLVTFKDGIKALFEKIFLFKGLTSRAEFNYGLLFLMIIGVGVSSIMSMSLVSQVDITNPNATALLTEMLLNSEFYLIFTLLYSLAFAIFLSAPVYRRLADLDIFGKSAVILTVIFVLGQLSPILQLFEQEANWFSALSTILSLVSFASTVIMLFCILKRGKN